MSILEGKLLLSGLIEGKLYMCDTNANFKIEVEIDDSDGAPPRKSMRLRSL